MRGVPRRHHQQLARTRRGSAARSSAGRCTPTASRSPPRRSPRSARFADKVIFNSVSQLDRLAARVGGVRLGLRVNPGVSYSRVRPRRPGPPALAARRRRRCRAARASPATVRADVPLQLRERGLRRAARRRRPTSPTATPTCSHAMEWVSLGGGIAFTTPGYPVDRFSALLRGLARPVRRAGVPRARRGVHHVERRARDDGARRRAQRGRHRDRRRLRRGAHARPPDLRHVIRGSMSPAAGGHRTGHDRRAHVPRR